MSGSSYVSIERQDNYSLRSVDSRVSFLPRRDRNSDHSDIKEGAEGEEIQGFFKAGDLEEEFGGGDVPGEVEGMLPAQS